MQFGDHPDLALLTGAEMRAAERAAFARGLPSFEAMRRAGVAVAETIMARWPVGRGGEVHVLCGPGNNGGDGFVTAATLRAAGYGVRLHAVRAKSEYGGDAARAAAMWQGDASKPDSDAIAALDRSAIVVDALFGIGLDRALEGETAALIEAVNRAAATVIAVDIASGVHADDGRIMGAAIAADLTVTFGWRKLGHALQPGAEQCGEVVVADVGFNADDDLAAANPACRLNQPVLWAYPQPKPMHHKYQRGHAVIAGGAVMTGAARLAAHAARRVGIGLLTLAVAPEAWAVYAADQPGAIVRKAGDLAAFVSIAGEERITALLIGSGLEPDAATADLVRTGTALSRPTVLDGGGLTVLAGNSQLIEGRPDIVLTPHEGEFGRLFPDLVARPSKVERAREAARRTGCTIVLKGSDTVVAAPDGRIVVAAGAPPTLATAGSGDVLAGVITGLLGLEMQPFQAAAMGVWLHGQAAEGFGLGLIAEDLPDRLPAALAKALAQKG
jgi:hydroxyethylthiazole kinase-like uncharacterized protein yjeF